MRLEKCPEVAVSAVPASSRKEEHETQRINVPIQDGRAISLTGINLETRSWVGDMVLAQDASSHISIKSSPGPSGGLTVFFVFRIFSAGLYSRSPDFESRPICPNTELVLSLAVRFADRRRVVGSLGRWLLSSDSCQPSFAQISFLITATTHGDGN